MMSTAEIQEAIGLLELELARRDRLERLGMVVPPRTRPRRTPWGFAGIALMTAISALWGYSMVILAKLFVQWPVHLPT